MRVSVGEFDVVVGEFDVVIIVVAYRGTGILVVGEFSPGSGIYAVPVIQYFRIRTSCRYRRSSGFVKCIFKLGVGELDVGSGIYAVPHIQFFSYGRRFRGAVFGIRASGKPELVVEFRCKLGSGIYAVPGIQFFSFNHRAFRNNFLRTGIVGRAGRYCGIVGVVGFRVGVVDVGGFELRGGIRTVPGLQLVNVVRSFRAVLRIGGGCFQYYFSKFWRRRSYFRLVVRVGVVRFERGSGVYAMYKSRVIEFIIRTSAVPVFCRR
jgi:hypothetical protein